MRETRGRELVVRFEASKCIHRAHCVRSLPKVFVPADGAGWIHLEGADEARVAEVIEGCPTGALTYAWQDGRSEAPAVRGTVRLAEDGPLELRGALTIQKRAGGDERDARLRATLCRCGASARKPYCDGAHTKVGFRAEGDPPVRDHEPLAPPSSEGAEEVRVGLRSRGPLKIEGPLRVLGASGGTLFEGREVFLCRCGASGSKPYCDGSHNRVGWRDE